METREWTFCDKSKWGDGPWQSEPDKRQWVSAAGLPCLIVRGPSGALCGYVGVAPGHMFYNYDYDSVDIEGPHGGLTFSGLCSGTEHGICHVVGPDEEENVWWLGFDCAHSGDYCPKTKEFDDDFYVKFSQYAHLRYNNVYRDLAYVTAECERLAATLAAA